MLASELLEIDGLEEQGVFDPVIDGDSHFFINIIRLKQTTTVEFSGSYNRINAYFSDLATILNAADSKSRKDKFYRAALSRFNFSEVNGINLGFAQSSMGAGFGSILTEQVISDAFDIVKRGCTAPEIFHLIGLFETNVGPDRLSDMIATIILPDIKAYTRRVYEQFNITLKHYPEHRFIDGFLVNPHKNCPLYFLPNEILHELPIAKYWEQVDSAISENNAIRAQINAEIGYEWSRWASSKKKDYLKRKVFMEPETLEAVLNCYRKETLEAFDVLNDPDYFVERVWRKLKVFFDLEHGDKQQITSMDGADNIVNIFKDWVENNKGWADVRNADSKGQEESVQRLILLGAKFYIESNNLDINCEPNEGHGPVDFKISRGNDKTVVEVKLSSNSQYKHGYEEQVVRYAEAEHTENMIFVLVNVGNDVRVNRLQEIHDQNMKDGKRTPKLVVINAKPQKSASVG